ncbi:Uncharacterised protein [Streptococcus pneumoniae]|nr:Uncharacterised protein [Streptococcus pneumoniae]
MIIIIPMRESPPGSEPFKKMISPSTVKTIVPACVASTAPSRARLSFAKSVAKKNVIVAITPEHNANKNP